jgi:Flp pilus assembly protein TadB
MTLMFTSTTGLTLLGVGAILLIVGGIWLKRVSEVEI